MTPHILRRGQKLQRKPSSADAVSHTLLCHQKPSKWVASRRRRCLRHCRPPEQAVDASQQSSGNASSTAADANTEQQQQSQQQQYSNNGSGELAGRQDDANLANDVPTELLPVHPGDAKELLSEGLPARYKIVLLCTVAFIVCNMDKVNMSVAIIPMARDFDWSPSVAGIVQSSFFYGYMACQIPAGYLANRFSGRWLLPVGVGTWSGFTAAVPLFGSMVPTLCVARAAVGLGEGVAPSAVNDIVVKSVPKSERARAISTIFGGLHVGSIAGLLLAPPLIDQYGWEAVFYVFGVLGLVWVAGFEAIVRSGAAGGDMAAARKAMRSEMAATGVSTGVPYRAFLRNGPTRALMFTHFANNWFHYTMLAWLPSYFTQTLAIGLGQASTVSLFPSIAGVGVSAIAGQIADRLIEGGMPVRRVRQLAQSTAFVAPAACLCAASVFEGSDVSIAFVSAALGLNSFSLSGLYCTHQDMSPQFAGPLLGLTNTSGAIPGIIGVATVGVLYDTTRSWFLALFAPCCVAFLIGTFVYVTAASSEEQDFSNNEPFAFEKWIAEWRSKMLPP